MATTWYAQGNGNIDAITWNSAADGSGSNLTWAELAADDTLRANGKTVTINTNITCAQIDTVSSGGGFSVSAARTIDALIQGGTTPCLNPTGSGYTLTISKNVLGGSAAGAYGINNACTSGTINITGNVSGGGNNTAHGIYNGSGGGVTVTGNSNGSATHGAYGIFNNGAGAVVVNGNSTGGNGTNSIGVYNLSSGSVTINDATVSGGSGANSRGVVNGSSGAVTINRCNLINTAGGSAVAGAFVWNPDPDNYIQCVGPGATTIKAPQQLAAENVKLGVVHGDITGTYSSGGSLGVGRGIV